MAFPKMTLSIELIGINGVNINLLHVTNFYINNHINIGTSNRWAFAVDDYFDIDFFAGRVKLPEKPNIDKDTLEIKFFDDQIRKMLLKDFHKSLIDWSSNHFFRTNKIFHPVPHIEFNDKLWVIF